MVNCNSRAIASVDAKNFTFCPSKTYFFYFTHQFLQNNHVSLSILYIYSIKYSFFLTVISLTDPRQPNQPPSSNHPTTIIKPHNNPTTIPFNQAPSMKFTYSFNRATIITVIKPPSKTYPNPKIQKLIYQKEWGTAVKVKESEERRWPEQQRATA